MKAEILTQFKEETVEQHRKTWISQAIADILVDDVLYEDVHFRVYTGQVMSAAVVHIDFTEKITDALTVWWYGVNFGDTRYEVGEEFTLKRKRI